MDVKIDTLGGEKRRKKREKEREREREREGRKEGRNLKGRRGRRLG